MRYPGNACMDYKSFRNNSEVTDYVYDLGNPAVATYII